MLHILDRSEMTKQGKTWLYKLLHKTDLIIKTIIRQVGMILLLWNHIIDIHKLREQHIQKIQKIYKFLPALGYIFYFAIFRMVWKPELEFSNSICNALKISLYTQILSWTVEYDYTGLLFVCLTLTAADKTECASICWTIKLGSPIQERVTTGLAERGCSPYTYTAVFWEKALMSVCGLLVFF